MLKEYAVEPAAMGSSWETFKYLIGLLTFEQGRRISRFPSDWEKRVLAEAETSGIGPVKVASVVERLKRARERGSIVDFHRGYDPKLGWIANALAQHQLRPFHAIIAEANPGNDSVVVCRSDVDDVHALFLSTHSWEIPRTGKAIAAAVAPLACTAKEILIVDPFMDWRDVPRGKGYRDFLSEMFTCLTAQGHTGCAVQLHFKRLDERPPQTLVLRNARRLLNGLLPVGFRFELYEWEERDNGEDFHDRHILCDCGGLSIGAGFSAVGAHQHAEVILKPYELTQTLKARFTPRTAPFNLVGKVIRITSDGVATEL